MKVKKVVITAVISLFVWQSVAEAASISTRVRILESKVAKHDKQVKASTKSQKESEARIEKSLAKVKALEKKINKLLKDKDNKKKQNSLSDKRYAFP